MPKLALDFAREVKAGTLLDHFPEGKPLDTCRVLNGGLMYETTFIDTHEKFELFLDVLDSLSKPLVAFDTETDGLYGKIVGMSFATSETKGFYIPLEHVSGVQLSPEYIMARMKPYFESEKLWWVCYNAAYELNVLEPYGLTLKNFHDAMLIWNLIDENPTKALKDRSQIELGLTAAIHYEEVVGKKDIMISTVHIVKAGIYAAQDAVLTMIMYNKGKNHEEFAQFRRTYLEIELPIARITAHMIRKGLLVDVKKIAEIKEALLKKKAEMEVLIFYEASFNRETGKHEAYQDEDGTWVNLLEFNLQSPKQKIAILIDRLGLPVVELTPSGAPATDSKKALPKWITQGYKIAEYLLEWSKVTKILQAYTDQIVEKLDQWGRLHPSFNPTGTKTGRFSCIVEGTPIEVLRNIEEYPEGIPIEEVEPGMQAYTYDGTKLTIKPVVQRFDQGYSDDVYEVKWMSPNGSKHGRLRATGDHKVRLLDGSYKQVRDLKPCDKVLSLSRSIDPHGYPVLHYRFGKLQEHRFIASTLTADYDPNIHDCHHKDFRKKNNHPSNFEILTRSEHRSLHAKINANKPTKRAKSSAVMKQLWADGKVAVRSGDEASNKLRYTRYQVLKMLSACGGKITRIKELHDFDSFKGRAHELGVDPFFVKDFYDKQGSYISRGRLARLLQEHLYAHKIAPVLGLGVSKVKRLIEYYQLNNHTIFSVEKLPGTFKIWDIEVAETHNFIASGICVKNCSGPNFQSMPKKTMKGLPSIRSAFIAPEGYTFICSDYSQLELRVAAHFSGETNMIEAFKNGIDLHKKNYVKFVEDLWPDKIKAKLEELDDIAEDFFLDETERDANMRACQAALEVLKARYENNTLEDVTKEERDGIKAVAFGIQYGMWVREDLGVTEEFIHGYLNANPNLRDYMNAHKRRCAELGYTRTLVGRKRRQYGARNFSNRAKQSEAFRQLFSAHIQGSAADIMKMAMVKIWDYIQAHNIDCHMIAQVHDEILLECKDEYVEEMINVVRDCMENAFELDCPLEAEPHAGRTWEEAKG